jgi:phosphoribosylanthranilate isomerase
MFLFDAKPPKTPDALPGGNAVSFDWRILQGETFARPWFLSGGLTPDNVAAAVASSGALFVDVSSGVETAPGKKDAAKIAAFIAALEETDV